MRSPPSYHGLDEAVSTGPAARRLGVSEAWLRKLIRAGRLPSIPTPLGRLIPKDALEAYAREREQAASEGQA